MRQDDDMGLKKLTCLKNPAFVVPLPLVFPPFTFIYIVPSKSSKNLAKKISPLARVPPFSPTAFWPSVKYQVMGIGQLLVIVWLRSPGNTRVPGAKKAASPMARR